MNNLERLKSMSDDELLAFLYNLELEAYAAGTFEDESLINTEEEWRKWGKKEVK